MRQRFFLLVMTLGWMGLLLGYMELRHDVERIGPRTALVTNHFSGQVRSCRTYASGDWSCHPVDVQPRLWLFALIPFWPARDDPGGALGPLERWTEPRPFTESPFFSDLISNAVIGCLMLGLGVYIMRMKDDDEGGSADGGSDGGGAGAGGE